MLKKQEYIFFEVLFEVPYDNNINNISDDFYQTLEFKFRITDISEIERLTKINSSDSRRRISSRSTIYMAFLTLLMGLYLVNSSYFSENLGLKTGKSSIEFCIVNENNDTILSSLSAINKDKIEIQSNGVVIEQSVEQFNHNNQIPKINKIITSNSLQVFYSILGGVYIFIAITFMALYIFKRKRYDNKK